jgi:hypothetical protein
MRVVGQIGNLARAGNRGRTGLFATVSSRVTPVAQEATLPTAETSPAHKTRC